MTPRTIKYNKHKITTYTLDVRLTFAAIGFLARLIDYDLHPQKTPKQYADEHNAQFEDDEYHIEPYFILSLTENLEKCGYLSSDNQYIYVTNYSPTAKFVG